MLISLLKFLDPLVTLCFQIHDFASNFITENFILIKRSILIVSYLSLFWIFFPEMRKDFGNFAETMLLGILFLSPLSKIFRMRLLAQLMGLRRELGILMGCFALVHGVAYFVDPVSFSLNIAPYLNSQFFSMDPLFYFGIVALIVTIPLLLT
ncbi:MAG: ferric reductase-like transmembrane domain-containing protein, partial [Candidatus Moraniibacteriota bacterium]